MSVVFSLFPLLPRFLRTLFFFYRQSTCETLYRVLALYTTRHYYCKCFMSLLNMVNVTISIDMS